MLQLLGDHLARSVFHMPATEAGSFPRKVAVDFEMGRYRVRTIDTEAEFAQVRTLRRDVFMAEFGGKDLVFLNSRDEFDELSDVLVISDERRGIIVGAYRLISSLFADRFYSETEFSLKSFRELGGVKLELSRACIAPEYRNGIVISLLWRGLAEYARLTEVDYLFGLSSVPTVCEEAAAAIFCDFSNKGLVDLTFGIRPRFGGKVKDLSEAVRRAVASGDVQQASLNLVPSLLKSYIKAGARLCAYPVIDHEFRCTDFLTVLRWANLALPFLRRFAEN